MKQWQYQTMTSLLAGALTMGSGCKTPPPPMPPQPVAPLNLPPQRVTEARDLAQRDTQLQQSLDQLPGDTTDQHRIIVGAVLEQFDKMLQLAEGENPPPEFANRLQVLEGAQSVLSQIGLPKPRLEAVENDAAHAIQGCLERIVADHVSDDTSLPTMLDAARVAVEKAFVAHGPMHDLDASSAFIAQGKVMQQISSDLYEEFGEYQPATSQPTSLQPAP